MADLSVNFAGIKSPNPFWLASAPPTDKAYNVNRAFEAGWGGVVWKTLGEAGPPVVNVNGPRYGALLTPDRRLMGFNNIELITDRDLEINLREIREVKREWADRAMIVSLMVPCEEASWKAILARVEDTGADGIELSAEHAVVQQHDDGFGTVLRGGGQLLAVHPGLDVVDGHGTDHQSHHRIGRNAQGEQWNEGGLRAGVVGGPSSRC